MIVGIQLYSSLSLLARQSMVMLTELPGMVTVFEQFFQLEYSDSYTCNIHHYCICHSQGTAFETLLALNSHARDMYMYSEAMLNIVVYQMLIVTNVPVNSANLWQFMHGVTLLLILVDTGLKELYLPLLVTGSTLHNVMGVKTHLSVSVKLR